MSRKGRYRYKAPAKRGYQVRHVVREFLKDQAVNSRDVPPLTDFLGQRS